MSRQFAEGEKSSLKCYLLSDSIYAVFFKYHFSNREWISGFLVCGTGSEEQQREVILVIKEQCKRSPE
jgi:hypothetical protein